MPHIRHVIDILLWTLSRWTLLFPSASAWNWSHIIIQLNLHEFWQSSDLSSLSSQKNQCNHIQSILGIKPLFCVALLSLCISSHRDLQSCGWSWTEHIVVYSSAVSMNVICIMTKFLWELIQSSVWLTILSTCRHSSPIIYTVILGKPHNKFSPLSDKSSTILFWDFPTIFHDTHTKISLTSNTIRSQSMHSKHLEYWPRFLQRSSWWPAKILMLYIFLTILCSMVPCLSDLWVALWPILYCAQHSPSHWLSIIHSTVYFIWISLCV